MWFPRQILGRNGRKKSYVSTCVQFTRVTFLFTKNTDSSCVKRPIYGRGIHEQSMENTLENRRKVSLQGFTRNNCKKTLKLQELLNWEFVSSRSQYDGLFVWRTWVSHAEIANNLLDRQVGLFLWRFTDSKVRFHMKHRLTNRGSTSNPCVSGHF